jgi:hypothetical protein
MHQNLGRPALSSFSLGGEGSSAPSLDGSKELYITHRKYKLPESTDLRKVPSRPDQVQVQVSLLHWPVLVPWLNWTAAVDI